MLFGSVFGAILGPSVFGPLFADRELDAAALTVPWLVAAGISLLPLVLIWFVRPDPKRIAELLAPQDTAVSRPRRSARSCAGPACAPRCWPRSRASA